MFNRQLLKRAAVGFLLMLSAVGVVGFLYTISERPNSVKNGFNRKMLPVRLTIVNAVKRDRNISNVIGYTAGHFYYQTGDAGVVAVSATNLDSFRYLTIDIADKERIGSAFSGEVNYPYYYIYAGNMRCVISADLTGRAATQYYHTKDLFTRAVKVSPTAFMFRGIDTTYAKIDQVFIRQDTMRKAKTIKSFTQRRDDAGFSTDGLLHYDTAGGRLLYLYFYSNQFICFDTGFNIIYTGNTIDTIKSVPGVETITTKSRDIVSFSRPMPLINAYNCIDGEYIYNYSTLQADNESDTAFRGNSAIDMYSLKNGKYAGSLYIPAYDSEKIKFFKVYGNAVVALYQHYIVVYKMNYDR